MGNDTHRRETAYQLQTPQDHRRHYDAWAPSYESDFIATSGYAYHLRIADLFARLRPMHTGTIIDIGCGTGIVGEALRAAGITAPIDGVDISEGMLAGARAKGIYGDLFCADLTEPQSLPHKRFDAVISAGTFTHGHLGPDALAHIFRLAAPGCFALIGINAAHFDDMAFAEAFAAWQQQGLVSQPDWHMMAIYTEAARAETDSLMARVAAFTIDPSGGMTGETT